MTGEFSGDRSEQCPERPERRLLWWAGWVSPVQPETEEQPQVKNLVSHFPTSALGEWEITEQPPNEDMRWGDQDLSFTEQKRGPGSPDGRGQCASNAVVTGATKLDVCFPKPPLGLWTRELPGGPWGVLRRAKVRCRSHKGFGWSARPCGQSQPLDISLWPPEPRESSTRKNHEDKPLRRAKGHGRKTQGETK